MIHAETTETIPMLLAVGAIDNRIAGTNPLNVSTIDSRYKGDPDKLDYSSSN